MMDSVVHCDLYKGDRGKLEHATEVDHLIQLLTAECFKLPQTRGKALIKPGGNAGRVCDRLRAVHRGEIKCPRGYSAQKALFRCHNVPGQFQGSFGNGVRAIFALVQGDGFDHPLCRLVFGLECGQCQTEYEFGFIGRELRRRHVFSPFH